jgi:hypothetical protein
MPEMPCKWSTTTSVAAPAATLYRISRKKEERKRKAEKRRNEEEKRDEESRRKKKEERRKKKEERRKKKEEVSTRYSDHRSRCSCHEYRTTYEHNFIHTSSKVQNVDSQQQQGSNRIEP